MILIKERTIEVTQDQTTSLPWTDVDRHSIPTGRIPRRRRCLGSRHAASALAPRRTPLPEPYILRSNSNAPRVREKREEGKTAGQPWSPRRPLMGHCDSKRARSYLYKSSSRGHRHKWTRGMHRSLWFVAWMLFLILARGKQGLWSPENGQFPRFEVTTFNNNILVTEAHKTDFCNIKICNRESGGYVEGKDEIPLMRVEFQRKGER